MKIIGIFLISFCFSFPSFAFDHSYVNWNSILANYVERTGPKSVVDYNALSSKKADLVKIATKFSAVKKEEFNSWDKNLQLAFLINAYNVFTLQLVVEHYPVDSIKDSKISWLSPFKKDFFSLFGKEMSLGHLEHQILRKDYTESRIHFAINCASVGCPALLEEAFIGESLDQQLDKAAKLFANDKSRNKINQQEQELQVSKIFDWFESDFKRDFGSVKAFFIRYKDMSNEEKTFVLKNSTDVEHLNYDWNLNKKN